MADHLEIRWTQRVFFLFLFSVLNCIDWWSHARLLRKWNSQAMLVMNDDGPVGGVWFEGGCVLLLLIA